MPAPRLPKRKFTGHHTENVGKGAAAPAQFRPGCGGPLESHVCRVVWPDLLSAYYAAFSACAARSPKSSISHLRYPRVMSAKPR